MRELSQRHGIASVALLTLACDRAPSLVEDDADFDDPRQSAFVPVPDFGDDVIYECDLFLQDCPAGFKCAPWAASSNFDATKCVAVPEDAAEVGAECYVESLFGGLDDCERGSMCWRFDPSTALGTCHAMVLGSEDHPMCANALDTEWLGGSLRLSLCLPGCDPLDPVCGPGEGCYAGIGPFTCARTAWRDAAVSGEPCEYNNECDAGLACIDDEVPGCVGEPGCCSPFCDVDDPECPAGTACQPWEPTVIVPGQENAGICRG